jgi:hypothetical protein
VVKSFITLGPDVTSACRRTRQNEKTTKGDISWSKMTIFRQKKQKLFLVKKILFFVFWRKMTVLGQMQHFWAFLMDVASS